MTSFISQCNNLEGTPNFINTKIDKTNGSVLSLSEATNYLYGHVPGLTVVDNLLKQAKLRFLDLTLKRNSEYTVAYKTISYRQTKNTLEMVVYTKIL